MQELAKSSPCREPHTQNLMPNPGCLGIKQLIPAQESSLSYKGSAETQIPSHTNWSATQKSPKLVGSAWNFFLGVIRAAYINNLSALSLFPNGKTSVDSILSNPCSRHDLQWCDERRCLRCWGSWGAVGSLHTAPRSASWPRLPRSWNETGTELSLRGTWGWIRSTSLCCWNETRHCSLQ